MQAGDRSKPCTYRAAESELLPGRLVAPCIDGQDHPLAEERDEMLDEVALLLNRSCASGWESDERYLALGGIRTLRVTPPASRRCTSSVRSTSFRAKPPDAAVDADLTVEPGVDSIVKVGGHDSVFELPISERQCA